jgi:hypothetical protein
MTRTGPADVVMSAYDLTTYGRPLIRRPRSRQPGSGRAGFGESVFGQAVFPGSASAKLAHRRPAGRSGRLRPGCQPPRRAQTALPSHPPCLPQPALALPLYLYLPGWLAIPIYGRSFDPGRDILCILTSPPRWLQWP